MFISAVQVENKCSEEFEAYRYLAVMERATTFFRKRELFKMCFPGEDKEFVDRSFGGQDWFQRRQGLIKATKATSREDTYDEIRAMLASLDDKYTRFLTPAMYDAVFSVATGDVALEIDVAFPIVHGPTGEDGTLQRVRKLCCLRYLIPELGDCGDYCPLSCRRKTH